MSPMNKIKLRKPIRKSTYIIIAVAGFVVLLGAWFVASEFELVDPLFLPNPINVVRQLIENCMDGSLWEDTKISVFRIVMGFLLAAVLGIPLGILCGSFKKCEALLRPLCEFIRYMPVPAFVPLMMVWVGINEMSKIMVIFIGTFFQLVLMVADDTGSVPDDLLASSYTLGAKQRTAVWKVLIPAMLPKLMQTLRMMIGWAWTYLVVAELVAANSGLGYSILKAQRFLQTETIFVGILVIGILGLVTDRLLGLLIKKMFPWAEGGVS